jgi:hypothetical protein
VHELRRPNNGIGWTGFDAHYAANTDIFVDYRYFLAFVYTKFWIKRFADFS